MNKIVHCPVLNTPCDLTKSEESGVTCGRCGYAGAWMNNELRLQQLAQAREISQQQQNQGART